jgi:glycosyltransferase involved in cell wall biosynthesis
MLQLEENKPVISIIIPCFNHGHFIKDALDSILKFPGIKQEIIIVDDGSTDNSAQKVYNLITNPKPFSENKIDGVIGTYKDYNFKIKLIAANVSRGPSAARNIGIKSCFDETDFFSFIDSDDMHISGKIKKTVKKMIEHQGYVGVVYCDYENLHVDKNKVDQQYKEPFCLERLLLECIIPPHSLVAKYAIEESGFFDEEMRVAEDYDWWIRIAKKFVCYHIPEKYVIMRTGKHNSSNTVEENIWVKNWARIRDKISNGS